MRFVSIVVWFAGSLSSVACAAVAEDESASASASASKQQVRPISAKSNCPAQRPKNGGQCNVAETCDYDVAGCGIVTATCVHHQWSTTSCTALVDAGSSSTDSAADTGTDTAVATDSSAAIDGCPADMPADGSPCGNTSEYCGYGSPACGIVFATCANNVWSVTTCSGG